MYNLRNDSSFDIGFPFVVLNTLCGLSIQGLLVFFQ